MYIFPVPSQCVVMNTIRKQQVMSVATKIALQIQSKMGGLLWHIEMPKDVSDCIIDCTKSVVICECNKVDSVRMLGSD